MSDRGPADRQPVCSIIPPNVLIDVAEQGDEQQRDAALRALAVTASLTARRATMSQTLSALQLSPADLDFLAPTREHHNRVYDAGHGGEAALPGRLLRADDGPKAEDPAANDAFDSAETTYRFYKDVFDRDSVDDAGLELVSSVHFEVNYGNAFWNGEQMVYGDGGSNGLLAGSLTGALDVIAHELTHGVTQFTARLAYRKQSGALNESMSDVFGTLVKQHTLGQDVTRADWLIGAGIIDPSLGGGALRSMAKPGTAFRYDRQPGHMDGYVDLPDDDDPHHDHGGVHINSGIPNHAFYLAATALGGNAWETAGPIWYDALTTGLRPTDGFAEAAAATVAAAEKRHGSTSAEAGAVRDAWNAVGVSAADSTA